MEREKYEFKSKISYKDDIINLLKNEIEDMKNEVKQKEDLLDQE